MRVAFCEQVNRKMEILMNDGTIVIEKTEMIETQPVKDFEFEISDFEPKFAPHPR